LEKVLSPPCCVRNTKGDELGVHLASGLGIKEMLTEKKEGGEGV